jgi:hypothetical protein
MTRLSKTLFVAAAMLAAPVSTAFAEEPVAGEEGAGGEGGEGGGAVDTTQAPVGGDVSASASVGVWSPSIIDRQLVLQKGKLAFQADVGIARAQFSVGSVSSDAETSAGLQIGAGYGVTEKITVGGTYGFTLSDFEIKGPLTLYGNYNLTDNGKLAVAAGADLEADLNGFDDMGESAVDLTIHAGLALRYKITPKFAVFSGNPYVPGPSGQHLSLGLTGNGSTFSVPVGVSFQATPELYTYLNTTLATFLLSDAGGGSRVATVDDTLPFTVGGWFNVNKNIDAGASFASDVHAFGDIMLVLVGARYYN